MKKVRIFRAWFSHGSGAVSALELQELYPGIGLNVNLYFFVLLSYFFCILETYYFCVPGSAPNSHCIFFVFLGKVEFNMDSNLKSFCPRVIRGKIVWSFGIWWFSFQADKKNTKKYKKVWQDYQKIRKKCRGTKKTQKNTKKTQKKYKKNTKKYKQNTKTSSFCIFFVFFSYFFCIPEAYFKFQVYGGMCSGCIFFCISAIGASPK